MIELDDNSHRTKCYYRLEMNFALSYLLHCLQMVDETMFVGRIHQSRSHRPMMEVQWAWQLDSAAAVVVLPVVVKMVAAQILVLVASSHFPMNRLNLKQKVIIFRHLECNRKRAADKKTRCTSYLKTN